jgi:hypothetical protein
VGYASATAPPETQQATASSAPGNPSPSPIRAFLYFLLCMQNE